MEITPTLYREWTKHISPSRCQPGSQGREKDAPRGLQMETDQLTYTLLTTVSHKVMLITTLASDWGGCVNIWEEVMLHCAKVYHKLCVCMH